MKVKSRVTHLVMGRYAGLILHCVSDQVRGEHLPAAVVQQVEERCEALELQHRQQVVVVVTREAQQTTQLPAQR